MTKFINHIDLNADLGEGFGPWKMGDDKAILECVSSANIACGGHAGDPHTMYETLLLAKANGVSVGAHPGYEDRAGFGRRIIPMSMDDITNMVAAQIGALMGVASLADVVVNYVKPHGALCNYAASDYEVAKAVLKAVKSIDTNLSVLAISGTQLEIAARDMNLNVFSEIFADRAYLKSGQLVPRTENGAVLHDIDAVTDRIIEFINTAKMPTIDGENIPLRADSICVHGDTPDALNLVTSLKAELEGHGVSIKSFV